MLLAQLREIIAQMRSDDLIKDELPSVARSIKVTFGWMIVSELMLVLQGFPVKYFIDEITRSGGARPSYIYVIAAVFAVVYKVGQFVRVRMDIHRHETYFGLWHIAWAYGNWCLLKQSSDWHSANSTGEKESLVGKNVSRFQSLFDEALFNTAPVTMRIIFTTIFMFIIGWPFGVIAVLTCLGYGLVLWRWEKKLSPNREAYQAQMRLVDESGSELNQNVRTIRTFGLEYRFAAENRDVLGEFKTAEVDRHRLAMKAFVRQDDVINTSRALLYLVCGLAMIYSFTEGVSFGTVVLATTWMEKAYSNFGRYNDLQRYLNQGLEALKELGAFVRLPPTIQNIDNPVWPEKATGRIEFQNVSFAYDSSDHIVIDSIDLVVEDGTSVGIVGDSGGGKSTLIKLFAREYDPCKGQITWSGCDLRHIDYTRFRQQAMASVSQHIELFKRSIADNIRIAAPDASDEEVIAAAKAASAHEFIVNMADGYNTVIGENGLTLSGGQRQRLAIARALILKPKVLVLDEATSALDAVRQAEIQATISELIARRTCTTIIIAHRLSTIRNADKIVVLDKGKVESMGTHDKLLKISPIYRRMVKIEH